MTGKTTRFATYRGECISLAELAARTGIPLENISGRHKKGVRGDSLWAPVRHRNLKRKGKETPTPPTNSTHLVADARIRDEAAKKAQRSVRLRQLERDAVKRLRDERPAALAQPLIDARLLSPKERASAIERVKNSGQRTWARNGTAS